MDEVDRANDLADELLRRNIAAASNHTKEADATGYCLFCDEPVTDPARWCDASCRDGWQQRRNLYRGA